jgi:SAM-dependent methyltransferase
LPNRRARVACARTFRRGAGGIVIHGFDPFRSFGDDVAATYDDSPRGDEAESVAFLRQLAGDGPALELAIGTGRIGLPLANSGVRVDGVEQSAAMIDQLKAKPGGAELSVVQGDMADVPVTGDYPLVFVVFNSIYNLLTQEAQIRCFANVASHLTPGGAFVLEAALPGTDETEPGPSYRLDQQYVAAEEVEADRVVLDVGRYDQSTQLLSKCRVIIESGQMRLSPIALRFAAPAELDLMARLAGLHLDARWGGWRGEAFTSTSRRHVSVYRR